MLYAHLLPGERRHLHRRLAEALAARADSETGLLAQHWHLAGCPDQAAPAAVAAARHAVSARAYPEAVRYYALGIELAAWLPESGPALLEEAARAASWAADPDRAAEWAAQALAEYGSASPADRARLLERIGRYRFEGGDLHAAVDATGQAVALLADGPPSALRARVLAALAGRRMLLGEFGEALPIAVRAVEEAQQAGRSPSTPMAWPLSASSRPSRASLTPGSRPCAGRSPSRSAPATLRTLSGPRPTSRTCCLPRPGSPRRSRSQRPDGRRPGHWTPRRR